MSLPGPSTRADRQAAGRKPTSASQAHSSVVSTTESVCGPFLDACLCRRAPITPRSAREMRARHRAAVARARRSGWGAWLDRAAATSRRWAA